MFGYVKPVVPELLVKEHEFYRATYCGICRSMKKHTGKLSNTMLSYDSVFLALVRMAYIDDSELATTHSRCIAHPMKKRCMLTDNSAVEYTARAFAVLAYYKAQDDLSDERLGKRLLIGASRPIARRARRLSLLPELENALIGAGLGETINVEITFPEDYVDEFVGKSAVFELTVNWIGNTVAPEYNDANVKKYLGYDSVAIYEEKYGETVIGQLLLDHLLHSVELEADFTSELSDLEEYLEKKHTKHTESNGMTRERYASEMLSQLVKHQNSEIYARFIGGGTCSVKATATDGTVREYGFMEMVDDAEVKGDVDLFSSCIRYIAVVHCVEKAVLEALVERYPELAMTDEEFDSAAREYLTGTLLMKDGEIAEYLDGYGREFTWCQLIGSAVIEKMKLKYVAEN